MSLMPIKMNGPNNMVAQPYYGGNPNQQGMVMNPQVNQQVQLVAGQGQNPNPSNQVNAPLRESTQVAANANPFKIEAYIQKFTLSVLDLLASTQQYIKNSKGDTRSTDSFNELAQKYESFEGYCDDLYAVVETSKQKYLQRNNTMDQSNHMQLDKLEQLRNTMRRMDNQLNGLPPSGETPVGNSQPSLSGDVHTPTGGVGTPYNATGSAVNTPIALSSSNFGLTMSTGNTPNMSGTPMSALHSPLLKPSPGDPGDGSQGLAAADATMESGSVPADMLDSVASQPLVQDDPMGLDSLDDLSGPINVEDFLV